MLIYFRNSGLRSQQVDEPTILAAGFHGHRNFAVIQIEVDEVAGPKGLSVKNLKNLVEICGSNLGAAQLIGASEAFVRQKSNGKIYKKTKICGACQGSINLSIK